MNESARHSARLRGWLVTVGLVLLVFALCFALRRQILNLWIRDPSFYDSLPSPDEASALLIHYRGSSFVVDRARDIEAFRRAAFSDGPWADPEPSMVYLMGLTGIVTGIGRDGTPVCSIIYHDAPLPWWGCMVRLVGIGPCLQYEDERRYFLIGRGWRRWFDHVAATYPRLHAVTVPTASANVSLVVVRAMAAEAGVVPSAVIWGGDGTVPGTTLYTFLLQGSAPITQGLPQAGQLAERQAEGRLAQILTAVWPCCTDEARRRDRAASRPFQFVRKGDLLVASTEVRLLLGPNRSDYDEALRKASVREWSAQDFPTRTVLLLFPRPPSRESLRALRWDLLRQAERRRP